MATSRILGLLAVATLIGVVPAGGQQVSTPAKRDRRVITTEEIEQAQANNALEVVEKLRPEFLRRVSQRQTIGAGATARGAGGSYGGGSEGPSVGTGGGAFGEDHGPGHSEPEAPPTAGVFVDGSEAGGIEELRQIQSNMVEEIRYLSGIDAQTKYGPRFPAGAIEVKLKTH